MAALSHAFTLAEIKKKLTKHDKEVDNLTVKLRTVELNCGALFASSYALDNVETRLQEQINYMKEEMNEMRIQFKSWPVEIVEKMDKFFRIFETVPQDVKKHDITLKKISDFFAALEEDLR